MATYPTNPYANFQMPGLLGQGGYVNPMQAGFGGAAQALAPMMGYTDRPTSIGQVLAAAGGGGMQGMQGAIGQNMNMQMVQQKMADAEVARKSAQNAAAGQAALNVSLGLPSNAPASAAQEIMRRKTEMAKVDPRRGMSGAAKMALDAGLVQGSPEFTAFVNRYAMKTDAPELPGLWDTIVADDWKAASEASATAGEKMFKLKEMQDLLSTGVPTGRLQDASVGVRGFFDDLGIKDPNLPIQEAIDSLGSSLALAEHQPGMGPMTDADFQIYRSIVPSLKGTELGNALVMKRVMRDTTAKQIYAKVLKEQIMAEGGAKNYDTEAAWTETRKRLDDKLGPLILRTTKAKIDASPDEYIGKVVFVDNQFFRVAPD